MTFVPSGLSRAIARKALITEANAPALLFSTGVAAMVGSTVLACRATLKAQEVLSTAQTDLDLIQQAAQVEGYSDNDRKKDRVIVLSRTTQRVVLLYAPAVAVGAFGLVMLTKSHHILSERNAALAAAYTAVDKAFNRYRERVVEKYGPEEDRYFRHGAEEVRVVDDATGKTVTRVRVPGDEEPSMYARFFDQSSANWSKEAEYNLVYLRSQQNWCNDLLKARGHVFLNEVYDELGIPRTKAGQVVGWILDGEGDDFIDFGLYDAQSQKVRDFVNGREGAILLDFNVNGLIYNKIGDPGERLKWQN